MWRNSSSTPNLKPRRKTGLVSKHQSCDNKKMPFPASGSISRLEQKYGIPKSKTKKNSLKSSSYRSEDSLKLLSPTTRGIPYSETAEIAKEIYRGLMEHKVKKHAVGILTQTLEKITGRREGREKRRPLSTETRVSGSRAQSARERSRKRTSGPFQMYGGPTLYASYAGPRPRSVSSHSSCFSNFSRRSAPFKSAEKLFYSPYLHVPVASLTNISNKFFNQNSKKSSNNPPFTWNDFAEDQHAPIRTNKPSYGRKRTTFRIEVIDDEEVGIPDLRPEDDVFTREDARYLFNLTIRKFVKKFLELPSCATQPDNYMLFLSELKIVVDALHAKREQLRDIDECLKDIDLEYNVDKLYRMIQGFMVYQAHLYNVSLAYANLPTDYALLILLVLCHVSREYQDVRILNITNLINHGRKAAICPYVIETLCRMSCMQRIYVSHDQLSPEFFRALKSRSSMTLELLAVEISGENVVHRILPFAGLYHFLRQYPRTQLAVSIDNTKESVSELIAFGNRNIPIVHVAVKVLTLTDQPTYKLSQLMRLIAIGCGSFLETIFVFFDGKGKFSQAKVYDLMTKCSTLREVAVCTAETPTSLYTLRYYRKYTAYSTVRCALIKQRSRNASFCYVEYSSSHGRRRLGEIDRPRLSPTTRTRRVFDPEML